VVLDDGDRVNRRPAAGDQGRDQRRLSGRPAEMVSGEVDGVRRPGRVRRRFAQLAAARGVQLGRGMRFVTIEPIKSCLARIPDRDQHWLWCSECQRFFHYDRLVDADTQWPRCPFGDCIGYGWDFHIFFWDQHREPEDPRWPSTTDELRHGMRSPEMDNWYEARRHARIETLAAVFEASPEQAGRGGARFVRAFLKMSGDLCWDLTDREEIAGFSEDAARGILQDLPVWAGTANEDDAEPMLRELQRFFDFAARTGAVLDAAQWRALLDEDGVTDWFVYTMQTDRRLRDQRSGRDAIAEHRGQRTGKRRRKRRRRRRRPR
jgi:hypothetical protein